MNTISVYLELLKEQNISLYEITECTKYLSYLESLNEDNITVYLKSLNEQTPSVYLNENQKSHKVSDIRIGINLSNTAYEHQEENHTT